MNLKFPRWTPGEVGGNFKFAALVVLAGFMLAATPSRAAVLVEIEKSTQTMYVTVNGVTRHQWPVSTGRGRFGTPNGVFRPQRLARTWFSSRYYNSPMPYSVFFHKGYAIHGTREISRLGGPASHGCVRLHPQNAAVLFALVQRSGPGQTRISIYP
jgi:lipoprotein-anchoring transpeptidase ErfK/SrfK